MQQVQVRADVLLNESVPAEVLDAIKARVAQIIRDEFFPSSLGVDVDVFEVRQITCDAHLGAVRK